MTESVTFLSLHLYLVEFYSLTTDTRLRHCATRWKVTGSIPDGVIGTAMALGSTQPLTEMSEGKGKVIPLQVRCGPEGG